MRTLLCTILLPLFVATAHAALPAGLSDTFRPVDGVVIKSSDSEFLLDLGTANGVREGDLVAVLAPTEELKHPVSGAVLGRIDHARGFLRIVRVKPDFSWAAPLAPLTVHPADPVRRYGEVPALFLDQSGDGHPLFVELQQALPQLAWRPWGEKLLAGPGLVFTREGTTLSVRDERSTLLGSWPLQLTESQPTSALPTREAAGKLPPLPPRFKGKATGLAIADLDGTGTREITIALEDRLEVGRYDGKTWSSVTNCELPGAVKALTLDSADLDGDGRAELLVTAVRDQRLASQVWKFDGTALQLVAKELPWYWRVMQLPAEGVVILGQSADRSAAVDYDGRPFRVLWRDGAPQTGAALSDFAAPTLHGSQPFPADGKTLWAWLDGGDALTVLDSGQTIWRSMESYGGGEAFVDAKAKNARDDGRRLFIRSRLGLDNDLVIIPQNLGSRAMSNRRQAEKSRMVALRWNGYGLEEAWSTPLREGYLADFARGDLDGDGKEEYLLLNTQGTGLLNAPQSLLFLWN